MSDGLREALDAHESWDWRWLRDGVWSGRTPSRNDNPPLACRCRCGWLSEPVKRSDSRARVNDWIDHREEAVLAALAETQP